MRRRSGGRCWKQRSGLVRLERWDCEWEGLWAETKSSRIAISHRLGRLSEGNASLVSVWMYGFWYRGEQHILLTSITPDSIGALLGVLSIGSPYQQLV